MRENIVRKINELKKIVFGFLFEKKNGFISDLLALQMQFDFNVETFKKMVILMW